MSTLGVCTQEGRCPLRPEEGTGCSQDGVSGCKMLCVGAGNLTQAFYESHREDIIFPFFTEVSLWQSHILYGFLLARGPVSQTPEPLGGFEHSTSSTGVGDECCVHCLTLQKDYRKLAYVHMDTTHHHTNYVTQTSFRTLLVDSASPAGHRRADCVDAYEAKLLPSRSRHTVQIVHTQPPVTSGKWWTL